MNKTRWMPILIVIAIGIVLGGLILTLDKPATVTADADDVHGGVLVERDAKCPFFVPGDADQGGNTATGDFVLFHVGWPGHDFKVRCGGQYMPGCVDERFGQVGTH